MCDNKHITCSASTALAVLAQRNPDFLYTLHCQHCATAGDLQLLAPQLLQFGSDKHPQILG